MHFFTQSSHVIYRFTGKWSCPRNLVPSNDALSWISKYDIIWSVEKQLNLLIN
ncbi:MAG: DUF1131 family protein [Arsenophonus sp.]